MGYYTKSTLYKKINNLRERLFDNSTDEHPLNTVMLCEEMHKNGFIGFERVQFENLSLRGMACVSEDDSEKDVILINGNLSPIEQNFYCTHELIHICLHRDLPNKQFNCYEKVKENQDSFLEWQANEGAAEMLIPYKSFLPKIKQTCSCYKGCDKADIMCYIVSEFAQQFNVSERVIEIRLESLKFEIDQYFSGTPLDDIIILSKNKQKESNISPKSLFMLLDNYI